MKHAYTIPTIIWWTVINLELAIVVNALKLIISTKTVLLLAPIHIRTMISIKKVIRRKMSPTIPASSTSYRQQKLNIIE